MVSLQPALHFSSVSGPVQKDGLKKKKKEKQVAEIRSHK
jgi:hypothetical protein